MYSTKLNSEDKGVDPFKVATTIASFCNYIFRRNFLKSKSIAIIPDNGYNPKQKTSVKCQLWLKYLSFKYSIFIEHAKNIGEKQCGKYFLDGFCDQNKTIYEFHGCYWHGCTMCYNSLTYNTVKQMYQFAVNSQHRSRIDFIKKELSDYKIVELWEHEWDVMCITDIELVNFLKFNSIEPPLIPRDSLYGGRTQAYILYHKCKENERIDYIDYTVNISFKNIKNKNNFYK